VRVCGYARACECLYVFARGGVRVFVCARACECAGVCACARPVPHAPPPQLLIPALFCSRGTCAPQHAVPPELSKGAQLCVSHACGWWRLPTHPCAVPFTPPARWLAVVDGAAQAPCLSFARVRLLRCRIQLIVYVTVVAVAVVAAGSAVLFSSHTHQRDTNLQVAIAKHEESSRAHRWIMGYVCHELRNPLHVRGVQGLEPWVCGAGVAKSLAMHAVRADRPSRVPSPVPRLGVCRGTHAPLAAGPPPSLAVDDLPCMCVSPLSPPVPWS
jgi:hypothetical protein